MDAIYDSTIQRLESLEGSALDGGELQTAILDRLCMCRSFDTPNSHMKDRLNKTECDSIGFNNRWSITTDTSIFKSLHAHLDGMDIVAGGVHARLFISHDKKPQVVVSFRHQEGDSLIDNDMWEAMGLWGRNFLQLEFPKLISGGSILDHASLVVQIVLFGIRYMLGLEYLPIATTLVDDIVGSNKFNSVSFTGYSMGGALAQLMAVYHESSAIVFASNGVLDILTMYQLPLSSKVSLINLLHPHDFVPKMDCQIGAIALNDNSTSQSPEEIHHEYVYGELAWNQLHQPVQFISGRAWSKENGFCMNDTMSPTDQHVQDSLYSQMISTIVLGLIVAVLVFCCFKRRGG